MIETEHRDGIAQLVLADPGRRNVLSGPMIGALLDAYDRAEADPAVRCVVLAARGPAFCAGAELTVLEGSATGDFTGVERVYRAFLRVAQSPLPSIAVVDGPAVGAGINLALACDLRVVSPGAVFDSRFTALRLLPGGGHAWLLDQLVGRQTATAMALFGERIGADDACRLGLAWRCCDTPAAARDLARSLAARVTGLERDFVTALTRSLRDATAQGSHELAVIHERYAQRWSATRPDFLAGVRAMRTRVERAPR